MWPRHRKPRIAGSPAFWEDGEEKSVDEKRIKQFRVVLLALLFCSLGILFWLNSRYYNKCPTTRNERVGAIYPLDNNGRFVYLTLAQHRSLLLSRVLTSPCGFWSASWKQETFGCAVLRSDSQLSSRPESLLEVIDYEHVNDSYSH